MSQNETLHLAQEFLSRMRGGAEPAEIAKLFSQTLEWEIAGDTGVLPWIGHKSGRAAITDFVRDSRAMIERISFEVHDILAGDNRAVIPGFRRLADGGGVVGEKPERVGRVSPAHESPIGRGRGGDSDRPQTSPPRLPIA